MEDHTVTLVRLKIKFILNTVSFVYVNFRWASTNKFHIEETSVNLVTPKHGGDYLILRALVKDYEVLHINSDMKNLDL